MPVQFGDVVLVHGEEFLSNLIRVVTRSYWSHAMLALEGGWFAQMGQSGFTISRVPLNRPIAVLRHPSLLNPYTREAQQILNQIRATIDYLRKNPPQFDYYNLFRLGVKLIQEQMAVSVAGKKMGPFVCSALVDYVYEQAGIDLQPDQDPRDTTPANLAELAFGDNPVFKVVYASKKSR